jgi:hypothetical protein
MGEEFYGRVEIKKDVSGLVAPPGTRAPVTIKLDGNEGDIIVRDDAGNERIRLDGNTGDIKVQGADVCEEFDVAEKEKIDSGTVLVIDDESKLQPCKEHYDKKVVGR